MDLLAAEETVVKRVSLELKGHQESQWVIPHSRMYAVIAAKAVCASYIANFFACNRVSQDPRVNLAKEDREESKGEM